MPGSRTSNLLGEGLRPPKRVSTRGQQPVEQPLKVAMPPFFRAPADSSVQVPPQKGQRRGEPAPKWCVGRLQPPVSTRSYRRYWRSTATYSRLEWLPPSDLFPLTASGNTLRNGQWDHHRCERNISGVGLLWQSLPAAVESAGVSRLFPVPPCSRLGCRPSEEILRQGTRTHSGRLQSDDSDPPRHAASSRSKPRPPLVRVLLGAFATGARMLATRKNPARYANLGRQPRPITVRIHPSVPSMSRCLLYLAVCVLYAVRTQSASRIKEGMRLNRQGGAGIVRLLFFSPQ